MASDDEGGMASRERQDQERSHEAPSAAPARKTPSAAPARKTLDGPSGVAR